MTAERRARLLDGAVLAGALLLALAVGEALVRWRGVDLHPAAGFRFHPDYGWTMDPAEMRVDGFLPSGFRSPPLDAPRGDGPRVLLLGDSFSVAVEHFWPKTYAGILAAALEARGGRLANLSAGGWGTAQEYRALLAEGLAWEPDVVVLQVFPYNDLCNNGLELADTCSWQDYLRPYYVPTDAGLRATWLHPWRGRARAASRLFGLGERQLRWQRLAVPGESAREFRRRTLERTRANARAAGLEVDGQLVSLLPEPHQPPAVRAAWAATEALLGAVHAALAERGVRLVGLVVPSAKTFGADWEALRRRHDVPLERDHGTRRVETALETLGATVISVRARLDAEGDLPRGVFNVANQHFGGRGHRLVAGWILEAVEGSEAPEPGSR